MSHFSFWKQILSYLFLSPMLTYKTFELKHIQIHGHSKTRIRWLIAAQIYKVLWNKRSNLIDHLFAISRCIMWSVKCAFYRKISLLASIGMSIAVSIFWIGWFNFNSLGGIYILFSTKSNVIWLVYSTSFYVPLSKLFSDIADLNPESRNYIDLMRLNYQPVLCTLFINNRTSREYKKGLIPIFSKIGA